MVTRSAPPTLLRELGTLFRLCLLYPPTHVRVRSAAERVVASCARSSVRIHLSLLGSDVVLQDSAVSAADPALQPLIQAIRASGFESIRFEPTTTVDDLVGWMVHLTSRREEPFGQGGVAAGYLDLSDRSGVHGLAAPAYLAALPRLEEALASLASARPEGLGVAHDIVRSIASNLTDRPDLFKPVRMLKGHDDYTFTHAVNVCALTTALGKAFGLSGPMLDTLSLAALCHDVGKQEVPLAVLNHQGPLDPEARKVMDGHPLFGARLLVKACEREGFSPLLPVVAFQHHIGLDRSGYPRMPHGDRIHPASQIVAVADVFDAMRTVRPYRPARSTAVACTVLIDDARRGRLNALCVSALVGLSGIMAPGLQIVLEDGRDAVLQRPGHVPLRPVVELDDGGLLDLACPGSPSIVRIRERRAADAS